MAKPNKFLEFIKEKQAECEEILKDIDYEEYVPQSRDFSRINCLESLSVIYLYFNEIEKAQIYLEILTRKYGSTGQYGKISEDSKKDPNIVSGIGSFLITVGIYLTFTRENPEKVRQLFEWAAENCTLPEDYIDTWIYSEYHNLIAVPYLWKGYALICLGNYSEALPLLNQVEPLFKEWKRTGGEIYEIIEYNLPKALTPLCKFKMNPTRQNLIDTQKGIEEYIKSLRIPRFKLEGYLYYFHLKEQFADVYNANPKDYPDVAEEPEEKKDILKLPSSKDEEETVWIWDLVSIVVGEEFGTDKELQEYAANISKLDGFPVLSSLFDLYMTWDEVGAESLYDEAKRLVEIPDINPEIIEKTKIILDLSRYSIEKGSGRLVLKPEDQE